MTNSSKALQDLFSKYTKLPIGGREIVCPYFMNDLKNGVYGPLGGKGKPEEIVDLVYSEAKKDELDINNLTSMEIIEFMKKKRIGVDCSGFAFWMLDAFDKERGGNGIADNIPGSAGKYIKARASASMLTSGEVAIKVAISEVKAGDMVRIRGGRHIAVVLGVKKDDIYKNTEELILAHSSPQAGVHSFKITITDAKDDLGIQTWSEKSEFNSANGDSIMRLKIFC